MKIKFLLLLLFCTNAMQLFAQKFEVKGTIKDQSTNEVLIGANIMYAPGKGTSTDLNGNYVLQLDSGSYEFTVSYVGYEMQKQNIKVTKNMRLDFSLQPTTLKEVEVTADIAKTRETPIAYTNISAAKLNEELGSRDLVMVLNTTPGVYATETGGGAGDARINIRGFDQRNIAVLVDGVPVNDLESGAVFWSNWAGISDILRLTQVQRGLGASKLAVASVGGTMNMITKGIESKRMFSIKQEVGNDYMFKTSLGINSGLLKGGWGITAAGTRTKGNGFADETWDDAWSFFGKVQKQAGKHLISLSASGAPQVHGQRSNRLNAAIYDSSYARSIGVNADSVIKNSVYKIVGPRGVRYNDNWGPLDRYELDNGDTIHNNENLNYRVNHFFKPVFNLTDYWTVNQKLFISNVLYVSSGNGGGTGTLGSIGIDDSTGQVNFQDIYKSNIKNIDAVYSTTEHKSTNTIVDSHNNHIWYGLLSTLNYDINKNFSFTGGIDLRGYKGTHYQTVYDYIGGDYIIDTRNFNQPKPTFPGDPNFQAQMKREGDHIGYDYYSHVKWGGLFTQLEYKKDKWSAFITLSGSETGYQRFDYFQKRDVEAPDTLFNNIIAWGDTLAYNGTDYFVNTGSHHFGYGGDTTYVLNNSGTVLAAIPNANQYFTDSPESRTSTTKEKWYPGYVAKAGANYNITEHHNVFINGGHLQIAPRFTSVFDFNNREYADTKAQLVDAIEAGYSFHSKQFAANLNGFYTMWKNKPYSRSATDPVTGFPVNYNINGVNELHQGVELDLMYKIIRQLTLEGTVSIGDWKYKSGGTVILYAENGDSLNSFVYSAQNVHVGDAAQTQYAASLRYEPIQGLYIKGQFIYFERYYADFDPTVLNGSNADRDSWKLPSYNTIDFFAGYNFNYWKINFNLTAGVFNVFDNVYISDARGNGGFDANTATVFISQGTRFNTSLKLTF
ncbi:MAG: carboxypeptidase-like regulatory domain-containing protein [Bacteroidia bacterium]